MKRIFAVLLLLLGIVLTILGALFKLESWELASELLILGLVLSLFGGILLFFKAFFQMGNGIGSKLKMPLLLLATGVVLVFLGAISKLESWGYASELLMLGNISQLIGVVWLVYKVLAGQR